MSAFVWIPAYNIRPSFPVGLKVFSSLPYEDTGFTKIFCNPLFCLVSGDLFVLLALPCISIVQVLKNGPFFVETFLLYVGISLMGAKLWKINENFSRFFKFFAIFAKKNICNFCKKNFLQFLQKKKRPPGSPNGLDMGLWMRIGYLRFFMISSGTSWMTLSSFVIFASSMRIIISMVVFETDFSIPERTAHA